MEIDFKKLLKQDPEFANFCREVVFKLICETNPQLIGMSYSMYATGVSSDTVVHAIKMMMLFNGGSDDKPGNNSKV